MYTIGISAFYHDSSVCLFRDGRLIFACEEEKFTGIKHDKSFPKKALKYITTQHKLTTEKIDSVCFYEDPSLKFNRVLDNSKKNFFRNPIHSIKSVVEVISNRVILNRELKKVSKNVYYSQHHNSHIFYSAFTSPFKESLVVSIDGVGEYETATYGIYDGVNVIIKPLSEYPNSIGLFYSAMTSFLGFKPNEGEYKVMGLSAYGNPEKYISKLRTLIYFNGDKLICDMDSFKWDRSDKGMFTYELSKRLELLPRVPDSAITNDHHDLAAAIQLRYEELFFRILKQLHLKYGIENLCLGGGCAYNGLANGKIYNKTGFKHVWIPPAPSDAGSSIGACIEKLVVEGQKPYIGRSPFLGPSYRIDERYKEYFGTNRYFYAKEDVLYRLVAKELKQGKVIGWFRDEIEFGSRALGHRSILADPTVKGMKDRINHLVKKREGFRPFAPMVTKERQRDFFWINDDVPYMNQVVMVKDEFKDILSATTHVDGTARVQTVYPNSDIHRLLREFELLSSYPILLNTSFNLRDKTMVLTPLQALNTFKESDIDVLVLQNYIIYKKRKS